MMMQRLRYFLVLAKEGSINRTASLLHISQSSLSRHLALLEQDLDATLFTRTAQGVQLTPAGHLLNEELPLRIQQLDQVFLNVRDLGKGKRQRLRVSYSPLSFQGNITKAIHIFQQEHVSVKLHLQPLQLSAQIEGLRNGRQDVGLLFSEGSFLKEEFYIQRLSQYDSVVVLPSGHELADRETLSFRELRSFPFLNYSENWAAARNDWFIKICRKSGFNPLIHFHPSHGFQDHLSLVVSENLLTLLPLTQPYFSFPGIKSIPLVDTKATWDLLVVWQRDNKSSSIKDLVRILRSSARQEN